MKIDKKKLLPALVIGLVFVGVIVAVQPYPMAAKRLPLVVSVLGVILTIIVIFQSLRAPLAGLGELHPEEAADHGLESGKEAAARKVIFSALAWVGGVLVFVYLLGLQFGLACYALLYCRLHGGKWLESIAVGLGVIAFIWVVFSVLLEALFPQGLLFQLLS